MAQLTAGEIVRVLEMPLGNEHCRFDDTALIRRHRRSIGKRYDELKRAGLGFSDASFQARTEWLTAQMDHEQ